MVALSHVQLFAIPWTVVCQAPLSMEFFRQEYWSGLPSPSPGDFSDPGIEPRCVSCTARDSLPLSCQGSYFETDIRACKTENTISFLLQKSGYLVTKLCLSTRLLRPWDSLGKSTGVGCHHLLPAQWYSLPIQEMQDQSLSWEDSLEKKWQLTPVFLPGKFHGQRSLADYSPWDSKELDMT